MALDPKLLEILACPEDKGPLLYFEDEAILYNPRLKRSYEVRDGILAADTALARLSLLEAPPPALAGGHQSGEEGGCQRVRQHRMPSGRRTSTGPVLPDQHRPEAGSKNGDPPHSIRRSRHQYRSR